MNGLALCAGVGGLELGIRLALGDEYRTVCFVEREAHAAAILVARMEDGTLDPAPLWDDLTTFDGLPWAGVVDLVSAGYPCQPFSHAGKRAGTDDPRHLWPHVARIITEVGPAIVVLENVPGHLSLGLDAVGGDLERMGYRAAVGIFSARSVGAPHQRERLFILAYRRCEHERLQRRWARPESEASGVGLADAGRGAVRIDHGRRWIQEAAAWADGGAVAHGDGRGWESERETPGGGRHHVDGGGEGLADPGCDQRGGRDRLRHAPGEHGGTPGADQEGGEPGAGQGGLGEIREPGDGGPVPALADAHDAHGWPGIPGVESGAGVGGDGSGIRGVDVGDPIGARPQGAERGGVRGTERGSQPGGRGGDLPLWPAGPGDRDAWGRILERAPELSPATQSPVRGMADGMAARVDRLRACGNGVVPLAAAYAIRTLALELVIDMDLDLTQGDGK